MYVTRTSPLPPAQRSITVKRRGGSTFEGLLEVEKISEDAVSAGENNSGEKRERNPQQNPSNPDNLAGQNRTLGGLDVKV